MTVPGGSLTRAAAISLGATVVVVAVKLIAGLISGSVSVLGEALQSTVDVAISLTALIVVRMAAIPPDREHPYGHGKVEVVSSLFQLLAIVGTSLAILWMAFQRLREPVEIETIPGLIAMGYAAISNTVVSRYLYRVTQANPSAALHAEALHLRLDTITSLGVLAGLVAVAVTGWVVLDPLVAGLLVVASVAMAARPLRETMHGLVDGALPPEDIAAMERAIRSHPEARGYHRVRSRQVGTHRFVDLHLLLDDHLTFVRAHEIAEEVEQEIRECLGGATVTIHYEPADAEVAHRKRRHGDDPPDPVAWSGREEG